VGRHLVHTRNRRGSDLAQTAPLTAISRVSRRQMRVWRRQTLESWAGLTPTSLVGQDQG
jgi:hypothetical protein